MPVDSHDHFVRGIQRRPGEAQIDYPHRPSMSAERGGEQPGAGVVAVDEDERLRHGTKPVVRQGDR
jgi:hypothetical protein